MFTLLKIPGVLLSAVSIISTSMSIGFLQATLEPHLRQVTWYCSIWNSWTVLSKSPEICWAIFRTMAMLYVLSTVSILSHGPRSDVCHQRRHLRHISSILGLGVWPAADEAEIRHCDWLFVRRRRFSAYWSCTFLRYAYVSLDYDLHLIETIL